MAFSPIFQRPFSATFDRRAAAAAAVPWWLAGGVAAANAIAVYQPKGAASLAASYVNLANPGTYNAAPGVAPTFAAATGWTFNGTTQYLMTGVTPSNGTWTVIARFSSAANTGYAIIEQHASIDFSTIHGFAPGRGTGPAVRYAFGDIVGSASRNVAPNLVAGVLAMAGPNCYRDGSSDGAIANSWTSTSAPYAIGARKQTSSAADLFFAGNIQAVAIYSTTLTAGEVAAVSAAMAAL